VNIGKNSSGPIVGRRVAVVGLSALSSCGVGKEALWDGLINGSPVGNGRVEDFDPGEWVGNEARHLDRFSQFAIAATEMALADCGDIGADPETSGVIIGTTVGGLETVEAQLRVLDARGSRRVSPRLTPMMMTNAAAGNISIRLGWHGPAEQLSTACATGPHVLNYAGRLIASGFCDVMIAGASEAGLTELMLSAFANMTALSSSGNSRPFDRDRDGFVLAEGAGVLVLEDWDRAVCRGAHIYAELVGAASTSDAHHITAPAPDGAGAAHCMRKALSDSGLEASDIGYVSAHGTSTLLNDAAESAAIEAVFGAGEVPVTSNKGSCGHSIAACGAIEAVGAVMSIEEGLIPPTAGLVNLDPGLHVDVVSGSARLWEPGYVISNSFGFGGHNGAVVFGPGER
jgi:3-oxoacyl-[acyl-carrier-protein] synthase II